MLQLNLERVMILLESLMSYCQNEFAGEAAKDTEMYRYISEVHALTKIHDIITPGVQKVRVGNPEEDGGYIMVKPYSRNKIAYSFGISGDVSWDLQMADEGYQIYQYDHTITELPVQNEAFHWKKIGLTGGEETESLKTFKTLIRENGHVNESGMLLKMDIENSEWDVFANAETDLLKQFDQIAIELHNFQDIVMANTRLQALRKIAEFFVPVHLHINNCGMIYFCGDLLAPMSVEFTFVKKNLFKVAPSVVKFPTFVDRRNTAWADNIVGRW